MKFLIVTHVDHVYKDGKYYGYAPYVREMNIWLKHVDEVLIVAPLSKRAITAIEIPYEHDHIDFKAVPAFSLTSGKEIIKTLLHLPMLLWAIFRYMRKTDHIHLRCPGNMGLLGCIVQICFPKKTKTAKYAGNWDPNSNQPASYRLQKKILKSTLLTKNMNTLVYGDWPNSTKNIKSFFTATYYEKDKQPLKAKLYTNHIKFLFVGTLSVGKQPKYVIQLVQGLKEKGYDVSLDVFGEGVLRNELETFIAAEQIASYITLHGNKTKTEIENAYKESHFMVLPSKSEGWPKVVAEAMFWGCIPVVTPISCVPYMLAEGQRGVLLSMELEKDVEAIKNVMASAGNCANIRQEGSEWSRTYTLDYFEAEIVKLL